MKSNKNNNLQSRRQFFKQAAKQTIPILGALVISNVPILKAAATPMGCDYGCKYACSSSCYGCKIVLASYLRVIFTIPQLGSGIFAQSAHTKLCFFFLPAKKRVKFFA